VSVNEIHTISNLNSFTYEEMRRDLLYVIHKTEIPDTYILLNREYKPLGFGTSWVRYEDFPNLHVYLTVADLAKLKTKLGASLYLFGEQPWNGKRAARNYLKRLREAYQILGDMVVGKEQSSFVDCFCAVP